MDHLNKIIKGERVTGGTHSKWKSTASGTTVPIVDYSKKDAIRAINYNDYLKRPKASFTGFPTSEEERATMKRIFETNEKFKPRKP